MSAVPPRTGRPCAFQRRCQRVAAAIAATALIVAGCGGGGNEDTGSDPAAAGSLAGVCPSPLVIQTDWFPEAEHGALYELMGDDYEVERNNRLVRGSLIDPGVGSSETGTSEAGQRTGIEWEIRTGGPAIGFAPVASVVYADDSIHLAYADTDLQIFSFDDVPLLSLAAPLEINPQVVMWDPQTHPEVETIADLGAADIPIVVDGTTGFSRAFEALGIWSGSQIDPSYDGSPTRLIATDGAVAMQGFASAEPFEWTRIEEWGRPLEFDLLHNGGYEIYSQTVAIRPDDRDDLAPCLAEVVPMIQQAVVNYHADPDRANAIIIDAVETFDDFWVYDEALADYSVATQQELGLVGNGPDSIVGNIDHERIQRVIDLLDEAGLDAPTLTPADLFTNEFIDPDIGFE